MLAMPRPASFTSIYPAAETAKRLSEVVRVESITEGKFTRLAGTVSEREVSLYWARKEPGPRIAPVFVATFGQRHGRTVLEGRFVTYAFTRVMILIVLGALAAFFCVTLSDIGYRKDWWVGSLLIAVLFVSILRVVSLGRRVGDADIPRVKAAIEAVLSGAPAATDQEGRRT